VMSKDDVDLIYEELSRLRLCNGRSDFSRNWLGREEAYYRGIQSREQSASVDVRVNLVAKLRDMGTCYLRSTHPSLHATGDVLLKLHGEFLNSILSEALVGVLDHADFE
jgi:hypothetical protein